MSVFKSEESKRAIRARYDEILSGFPFVKRYVDTKLGKTFLLEAGQRDGPALVLLHGSCSNSAFWFGELTALSPIFHMFAVDILGEAGNSEDVRLPLEGDGYADWLYEVLDQCGIERAAVMGNSLGSFMALKFAVKYPGRVEKLVLIAPAGLSAQNEEFIEMAKKDGGGKMTADNPVAEGAQLPPPVLEFINLILAGYNPVTSVLPLFTDGELLRLTMPVLMVAGERDVMLDAPGAAARLKTLLPEAEIHLLEGIGHMVVSALEYAHPFLVK
ncbi:putative carboxylesterase nap [bioreactor metagenome]|uniref:Putative carboxylesterase nap n=1 Tax=bioreactor metagenome TaxID=1076179 RepID=A0A644YIA2_9ZZZZ